MAITKRARRLFHRTRPRRHPIERASAQSHQADLERAIRLACRELDAVVVHCHNRSEAA
jgi:hypothetical protein